MYIYLEMFAPSKRGEANGFVFLVPFLPRPEKTQTLPGSAEKMKPTRASIYIEMFAPSRRGEANAFFFEAFLPLPEKTQKLPGSAEQIETNSREYIFIEMFAPSKRGEATAIFFGGVLPSSGANANATWQRGTN